MGENEYMENCKACHRVCSVTCGGVCDVKQNASGNSKHLNLNRRVQISQFLPPQTSPNADAVIKLHLFFLFILFYFMFQIGFEKHYTAGNIFFF